MISNIEPWELSQPKSSSEILCWNLEQGLHAAAQPLTVLQASLDSSLADQMSLDEFRELMASSALEVDRVCRFFSCLRQLVSTESIKPQLSRTKMSPLIANVVDGASQMYQKSGIFFCYNVTATCEAAFINGARTVEALSCVLLIAHAVSKVNETVELLVSPTSIGGIRIVVQNRKSNLKALGAEASLSMALAEANMRSQHATFAYCLLPFRVQIELRRA